MPEFHYVAKQTIVTEVSGSLTAADEADLRRQLAEQGLEIVSFTRQETTPEPMGRAIDDTHLAELVGQVGAAASTGLPLEVSLRTLAEEASDRRLAQVVRGLAEQLERGQTIEQAMATLGEQVPAELAGLLRAGIRCGNLAGLCESFSRLQAATRRTRNIVRSVVAYPLLILLILLPIALLFSEFVIPMFGNLFDDFDLELPMLSELVVAAGQMLPVLLITLLAIPIGIVVALRLFGGRWLLHRVRGATPLLGRLWMWSGQREFAATLASFLDLRLPLGECLSLTGTVLYDRNMARASEDVSHKSRLGSPLAVCLNESIHFDRSLVALVAWGEQHDALPDTLRLAGEIYEDRIEQYGSMLRRLIPPATLVIVATLVLFAVMGLFLPLVNLIGGLSG
jgi:type II secretory pathway component PulF